VSSVAPIAAGGPIRVVGAVAAASGLAGAWQCGRVLVGRRRARARLGSAAARGLERGTQPGVMRPWQRADWATVCVAGVVGIAAMAAVAEPMALVVGSMAAAATPIVVRSRRRAERRRLRRAQLPAALERLAMALRAGSPVPMAMVEVGAATPPPVGAELAALGREADAGRAVVDVLDGWGRRHDDAGTRLAATALALATTVGGTPGHAVDGVAMTLRERVELAEERRALASQARLSALVLALAPVGFAVLLGAADGAAASFLLGTPAGWFCLVTGLALDCAGAWWMARLTRGPET
jgi:tight adherence protein B